LGSNTYGLIRYASSKMIGMQSSLWLKAESRANVAFRDDWERESTKMGDIYGRAYLTIAACLATSDEDGFLHPSPAREAYRSVPILFHFCGQQFEGLRMRTPHDLRDGAGLEPLSTRGWTLQEKLLATQLLSFSSGVTLECPQASFCECGGGLYPNPFVPILEQSRHVDKNQLLKLLRTDIPDTVALLRLWEENVMADYSDRSLTNSSDMLPALSALADAFQLRLNDTYLAGLWKNNLLGTLQWHRPLRRDVGKNTYTIRNAKLAPPYRAPSWTWTSIDEPVVQHPRNKDRSNVQILAASCSLSSINPTGEVDGGILQLRAPTVQISLLIDKWKSDQQHYGPPVHISRKDSANKARATINLVIFDTLTEEAEAVSSTGQSYTTIRRFPAQTSAFREEPKKSRRSTLLSKFRSRGQRSSTSGKANSEPSHTIDNLSGEVIFMLLSENEEMKEYWLILGGMSEPPGSFQRIGVAQLHHQSNASQMLRKRAMMELTIY
jgi:hypothetical protein